MNNLNFDIDKYILGDSNSLKDYILLIRTNLRPFIFISLLIIAAAVAYAVFTENIHGNPPRIQAQPWNPVEGPQPRQALPTDPCRLLAA